MRAALPEHSVEEQWDIKSLEDVLAKEWQISLPLSKIRVHERIGGERESRLDELGRSPELTRR